MNKETTPIKIKFMKAKRNLNCFIKSKRREMIKRKENKKILILRIGK
jgi:hypothetical protein